MKLDKRNDLLLAPIEDYLEEYRRKELDGMVIEPAILQTETIHDSYSLEALLFIQINDEVAKA